MSKEDYDGIGTQRVSTGAPARGVASAGASLSSGVLAKYTRLVSTASKGAIMDRPD